jgi:hypothetical protein
LYKKMPDKSEPAHFLPRSLHQLLHP